LVVVSGLVTGLTEEKHMDRCKAYRIHNDNNTVAGRVEGARQGETVGLQHVLVVVDATGLAVESADQRRPAGRTHGILAIGRVMAQPLGGQPIQVRRGHHRIAGASHHVGVMLVGEQEKDVGAA
jgi:hypothetical protein